MLTDEKIYEIKCYLDNKYNESLSDISIQRIGEVEMVKFIFKVRISYEIINLDLRFYNMPTELIILPFTTISEDVVEEKFESLKIIIMNEVLPKWLPEFYLSIFYKKSEFGQKSFSTE